MLYQYFLDISTVDELMKFSQARRRAVRHNLVNYKTSRGKL